MTVRFRALLWVLVTFLLGALLGGASVFFWSGAHHHWGSGFQSRHWKDPQKSKQRILEYLSEHLELDADQKERLRAILQGSVELYRQARKKSRQEFRSIRDQTRQEIRELLCAHQLEKFDDFIHRRDRKRKHRD